MKLAPPVIPTSLKAAAGSLLAWKPWLRERTSMPDRRHSRRAGQRRRGVPGQRWRGEEWNNLHLPLRKHVPPLGFRRDAGGND
jgi:hypothetical protein